MSWLRCVDTGFERDDREAVWIPYTVSDTQYGGGLGVGVGLRSACGEGGLGSATRLRVVSIRLRPRDASVDAEER